MVAARAPWIWLFSVFKFAYTNISAVDHAITYIHTYIGWHDMASTLYIQPPRYVYFIRLHPPTKNDGANHTPEATWTKKKHHSRTAYTRNSKRGFEPIKTCSNMIKKNSVYTARRCGFFPPHILKVAAHSSTWYITRISMLYTIVWFFAWLTQKTARRARFVWNLIRRHFIYISKLLYTHCRLEPQWRGNPMQFRGASSGINGNARSIDFGNGVERRDDFDKTRIHCGYIYRDTYICHIGFRRAVWDLWIFPPPICVNFCPKVEFKVEVICLHRNCVHQIKLPRCGSSRIGNTAKLPAITVLGAN